MINVCICEPRKNEGKVDKCLIDDCALQCVFSDDYTCDGGECNCKGGNFLLDKLS